MKFITKNTNAVKIAAFESALENIFPQEGKALIEFKNELDVRPVLRTEIERAAHENARRLISEYRIKNPKEKDVFSIAVQKGTNFHEEEIGLLLCGVAIHSIDTTIELFTWSYEEVPLPPQMKPLVVGGTEIYDAYEIVYGEQFQNGKGSPFEIQTGRSEINWIRFTIEKALGELKKKLNIA